MSDIQGLLDAMQNEPGRFREGEYTFDDTKTRAEYWVSNGFWFYGMYRPSKYGFSLIDKWRFGRALKRWRAGYLHWLNTEGAKT